MKLNFKSYGAEGDVVIILHGIFGMLDNWHSFATQLSRDFQVFTLDHRNHGRSPHSESFTYEDMVEDLKEFITEKGFDRVSLIGHSLGGKTAMHFALEYPDLVDRLIVLDIGIKMYPQRHDYIFEALCGMDLSRFSSRNEIDEYLSESIHSFPIRQFLMKNIHRDVEKRFSWKMNLAVIRDHYDVLSEGIRSHVTFPKQTLFIRGANSSYVLLEDMGEIKKIFPLARLITIPGASHWLHAEKPYELLKLVQMFLGEQAS